MNTTEVSKKREKSQEQKCEDGEWKSIRAQLVSDKVAEIERVERIRLDAATKKSELNLKLDTILNKLPLN